MVQHPVYGKPEQLSERWRPMYSRPWHDRLIDYLLTNPGQTTKDIALALGKHPVTVSMVMGSDLFKARYEQRRKAFEVDLRDRLTGKIAKVAEKALDLTLERMENKRTAIPLPELVDLQDKTLAMLGFGAKGTGPAQVNVQVNNGATIVAPVSREALEESRNRLRQVEMGRTEAPGELRLQAVEVLPSADGAARGENEGAP